MVLETKEQNKEGSDDPKTPEDWIKYYEDNPKLLEEDDDESEEKKFDGEEYFDLAETHVQGRPKRKPGGKRSHDPEVRPLSAAEKARRADFSQERRRKNELANLLPLVNKSRFFRQNELNDEVTRSYAEWVIRSLELSDNENEKIHYSGENKRDDFIIDNMKSSQGPGGQHSDRKGTGVRLTHKVTGITSKVVTRSRESNISNAIVNIERDLKSQLKHWANLIWHIPKSEWDKKGAKEIRTALWNIYNGEI